MANTPNPIRYKATTPNPDFSGKTLGVKFENGVAVFDDYSLKQTKNPNQREAAEIAKAMRQDFGYTVEEVK